jgi:hypothetical protein
MAKRHNVPRWQTHKPKAVVVDTLEATQADLRKYMPKPVEQEKALPLSVRKELEDLFLKKA